MAQNDDDKIIRQTRISRMNPAPKRLSPGRKKKFPVLYTVTSRNEQQYRGEEGVEKKVGGRRTRSVATTRLCLSQNEFSTSAEAIGALIN